jgi:peptide-methionine (R)-S-oxide reductase
MNKTFLVIFLLAIVCFVGLNIWKTRAQEKPKENFAVVKSDAEWKKQLSPQAYSVLRHHDTERPNTSPLNKIKEPGEFVCAGCDQVLFNTKHKFDSGTGWPSFYQPANDVALGSTVDYKLVLARTEVHCSKCGGHLGHVFSDGPKPTGKRYCINGVSLKFRPQK